MGYHRAGFDEIVGVDIVPQPRYPFSFRQMDALEYATMAWPLFDVIHASPPCQAYTSLRTSWNAKAHIGRVDETRELLKSIGLPFVIENVPGAPLRPMFLLCGSMFGLGTGRAGLRRHRLFESNLPTLSLQPSCQHKAFTIGVYGGGHGESLHRAAKGQRNYTAAEQREAMGIDWMTVDELSQAIPPAYTQFIGAQLLNWRPAPPRTP